MILDPLMSSKIRLVYLAHPVAGNRILNLAKVKIWLKWAYGQPGIAPIAPYIPACEVIDETPENRARGLACDLVCLERCDELWLCGDHISEGMKGEANHAQRHGVVVVNQITSSGLPL